MTDTKKTIGSFGRRGRGSYDRAGPETLSDRGTEVRVFGKRIKPPMHVIALHTERLRAVYGELRLLFSDAALPETVPFRLKAEGGWVIQIGSMACVRIDRETGMFIFADDDPASTSLLMTASQDRLMSFIMAYLIRGEEPVAPANDLAVIEKLVGHSIRDLECALILTTLRHCSGSKARASEILGISPQKLRSKLRGYWQNDLAKFDFSQESFMPCARSSASSSDRTKGSALTDTAGTIATSNNQHA